jgi:hypothetical protein
MGAVTASGILALPLMQLKRLLAASGTFQDLVGVTTEAQAHERIHFQAYDVRDSQTRQLLHPRPRAIVMGRDFDRSKVGAGTWRGGGQLEFLLEVPVPADRLGQLDDEVIGLLVTLGAIGLEMEAKVGLPRSDNLGTYLHAVKCSYPNLQPDLLVDDAGCVQDDEEQTIGEPEYLMAIPVIVDWIG